MALIALRYARALAGAAGQDSPEVQHQLRGFRDLLRSAGDLKEILLNPTLAVRKRIGILHALATRAGIGATARNFLAVLIEHERLNHLDEILKQFQLEIDHRQGIAEAEVVTARPLEDDEREQLERHVAGLAGTRVRASFRQDESLLGGMIVRIGSTVYDGSIKGRLERLRERLVKD